MKQIKFMILFFVPIAIVMWVGNLRGFETDTHALLSEKATDASQLNNYLTTVLGFEFPQGTDEEVRQGEFKTVRQLIANVGAVDEDSPFTRTRAHFHDPTKAWAQAGLGQTFESSILWSQNPNQDLGGKHSWHDARDSFFNALTSTDPAQRKMYFAETFETLGHLIHHVQDAATPAHTRNDTHIGAFVGQGYGFPIGDPDRFHHWASRRGASAINASASQPFDPSILNQTYNGLVPIAGIIDTTTTAGQATPSDATNIGIAEYSNANFFSDDTILKDYAYPNTNQLDLTEESGPDGPEKRFYLKKNFAPGPTGYRAAVASRLSNSLPIGFAPQQWELDDNVMADYGALLFKRAIGYSAGLIDYFFRGRIQAMTGSLGCYWPQAPPLYPTAEIGIWNDSPDGEETGAGEISIVLLYEVGGVKYSIPWVSSAPIALDGWGQGMGKVITVSTAPLSAVPINTSWYDVSMIVTYRGALGQETNAVIGVKGFIVGYC